MNNKEQIKALKRLGYSDEEISEILNNEENEVDWI